MAVATLAWLPSGWCVVWLMSGWCLAGVWLVRLASGVAGPTEAVNYLSVTTTVLVFGVRLTGVAEPAEAVN